MKERIAVRVHFDPKNNPKDASKTKQSFKDECDINMIVKRYRKTGQFRDDILNKKQPIFGDFRHVTDFQGLASLMCDVNASFMRLDADVRAKFRNDPQQALDFLEVPENEDEARKMGLLPALTREEIEERANALENQPKAPETPGATA